MAHFTTELSRSVNAEARHRYAEVARLLGSSSLLSTVAPRLALRLETPYPYAFTEDDTLLPAAEESFGRVIQRSRAAGLKEIHATIGEQDKEHSWLYIPSDKLWVDTTVQATKTNVESDQYARIFLSHIYPEVEAIHTHPDSVVKDIARENPWDYSQNYLAEAAQPSSHDLIHHSQMVARTAPSSHQTDSVVSHYGVTSYHMPNSSARSGGFQSNPYDRLINDVTHPESAIREALGRLSATVLDWDNTPAFSIQFEPIE